MAGERASHSPKCPSAPVHWTIGKVSTMFYTHWLEASSKQHQYTSASRHFQQILFSSKGSLQIGQRGQLPQSPSLTWLFYMWYYLKIQCPYHVNFSHMKWCSACYKCVFKIFLSFLSSVRVYHYDLYNDFCKSEMFISSWGFLLHRFVPTELDILALLLWGTDTNFYFLYEKLKSDFKMISYLIFCFVLDSKLSPEPLHHQPTLFFLSTLAHM